MWYVIRFYHLFFNFSKTIPFPLVYKVDTNKNSICYTIEAAPTLIPDRYTFTTTLTTISLPQKQLLLEIS